MESIATIMPPLIGPKKRPQQFGFKAGDSHLIVNDFSETLTAYSFEGKELFKIAALARGQGGDRVYWENSTDTPPGLYKLGTIYNDVQRAGLQPAYDRTLQAYGWLSFDMEELEGQERRHNRAGIMLHGGGSGNGWPLAWAPIQPLLPTLGCVRIHNIDLRDRILPLTKQGTVFLSCYQEA
jgi:hypothetical protein